MAVRKDMEGMKRQHAFTRFIRAKQHSGLLQTLSKRLDRADASFIVSALPLSLLACVLTVPQRTMLTSADVQHTKILACVQPMRDEVHRLSNWARTFFLKPSSPVL